MAGGSRPNRALTASAICPGGTMGAVGVVTGGAAATGGGGATPPPGDTKLAPGDGVIGVGAAGPGAGTLGMGAGGIGACSPRNRLGICAETAVGHAKAKAQRHAATRHARTPKLPIPVVIALVLSNGIAAISSRMHGCR